MKSSRRPFFVLIALVGGLAIFSSTLSKTPVLPLFAASLHATPAEIGWIVIASTLPGILVSYPAGALSDYLGRQRVLLASLLVFASAPFLYLLIESAWQLMAVRFYHGFATAIFGTAASAAIAERYRADRAARLSAYSSVTHAGRSVAPFLGGTLISLASYDAVYIACAISGVLALAVGLLLNGVAPAPAEKPQSPHFRAQCYSLSPKTVRPEPVEGQPFDRLRANGAKRIRQIEPYYFRAGLASVLRDRGIMRVSLIEAAQYLVFGAVEAFLALYAAALGIPAWQIGGVLGVQLLSIVFTKPLMGRVSDRVGRRQVILPGLVIGAASVALLPLASGFIGLAGLSLLFGLGFATVTSSTTALVADLTRDGRFGSSMGVLRSVMDVGQSIGPVLTGYVVGSAGYGAAFMLLAAILLLATLLLVRSDSLSRPPAGP